MIRIARPDKGPASLKSLGERQTSLDCAAYDVCPADYHSGNANFPKRKYYSKRAVKDLLMQVHHCKCCYCEKRLRSPAYLHIEHFRPKSGVRQSLGQKNDELPGYYWLAYRWDNLLLSCHDCNSIHKGTFFPLADPKERARSHHHDIARERPLFVDPVGQDPRDHIRFDRDVPTGTSRQGRVTVKRIGLRRAALREDRLALLRLIETHHEILKLLPSAAKHREKARAAQLREKARAFIEAALQPDAEFSSMARDHLAHLGL